MVSKYLAQLGKTPFVKKYPEFIFIFAMMLAFLYAICAELVGLFCNRWGIHRRRPFKDVKLHQSRSLKEGAEYLQIIFASIFFVSLGIIADFLALTPEIILFLIALTIVAVITKVIGCGIPAKLWGLCTNDSLIVGFSMAPLDEVAMIVALIGLEAGLIGQGVYVTLVLMSLLTTLVTPIVYRNWFYKGDNCADDVIGK